MLCVEILESIPPFDAMRCRRAKCDRAAVPGLGQLLVLGIPPGLGGFVDQVIWMSEKLSIAVRR